MALAATGPISSAIAAMATLLEATTAAADWNVYQIARDAPDIDPDASPSEYKSPYERPFILVTWDQWTLQRGGFAIGTLQLLFQADVSDANKDSHRDASYEFCNVVGAILQEAIQDGEDAGKLCIRSQEGIQQTIPPMRSEEGDTRGDFYVAAYSVPWGLPQRG